MEAHQIAGAAVIIFVIGCSGVFLLTMKPFGSDFYIKPFHTHYSG